MVTTGLVPWLSGRVVKHASRRDTIVLVIQGRALGLACRVCR
jgi:hypothetical protein